MARKRLTKRKKTITVRRRVYRTVKITKTVKLAEACYERLGRLIKRQRKKLRLTQHELAALMNYDRGSIANTEVGRQRVPLHIIYDYARVLKVPLHKIMREII